MKQLRVSKNLVIIETNLLLEIDRSKEMLWKSPFVIVHTGHAGPRSLMDKRVHS